MKREQVIPAQVADAPKVCGHPFKHKVCLSAWAPAFAGVTDKCIFTFSDSLPRSVRPRKLSKKSEKEEKVIPAKVGIYSNILIFHVEWMPARHDASLTFAGKTCRSARKAACECFYNYDWINNCKISMLYWPGFNTTRNSKKCNKAKDLHKSQRSILRNWPLYSARMRKKTSSYCPDLKSGKHHSEGIKWPLR